MELLPPRRIPEEIHKSGEVPLIPPQIIAIIGPELSGKSTQGGVLSKRTNLPLISMGSMFRSAQNEDSELGERTRELQKRGGYADVDLFREVFQWGLREKDAYKNGFVIEGAPRTLEQFQAFQEIVEGLTGKSLPLDIVLLNMPRSRVDVRLQRREARDDDSQIETRLNEYYKDLAEKIKTVKGFSQHVIIVPTILRDKQGKIVGDRSIREVNNEIIERLGVDSTQIRSYREALLENETREMLDFGEIDMSDIGHDITTLPRKMRSEAILAYLKNLQKTLAESSFTGLELENFLRLQKYLEKLYAESI